MTIPTYSGMQTALSGLQAYQAAIDTTGENISNASTPGYSRQRVVLGESDPLDIQDLSRTSGEGAQLGTGTSIEGISRVRDPFLDTQYRTQNSTASYDSTMSDELGQVQTALDEPSTSGISSALSSFWSAWNTLSTAAPGSSAGAAAQAAVVGAAQTLASTFNAVSSQMSTVQQQAATQLQALTDPTNGQVAQDANGIAKLNTQIESEQAAGLTPNDLLDQRDSLLDDLSSLANTTSTADTNGDGGITVTFGGQPLIDSTNAVTLPATSSITKDWGGELGALANLSDTSSSGAIQSLSSQLDQIATTVQTTVNDALGSSDFFTGTGAGDLQVGSDAAATLSTTSTSTAADLAGQSGGPIDQSFSGFVTTVGDTVQSAQNAASTSSSLLTAIDNQRESVSGVSLDEEMSNLITFQQGYEASARMMSTMDNVIETLINSVGGSGL